MAGLTRSDGGAKFKTRVDPNGRVAKSTRPLDATREMRLHDDAVKHIWIAAVCAMASIAGGGYAGFSFATAGIGTYGVVACVAALTVLGLVALKRKMPEKNSPKFDK